MALGKQGCPGWAFVYIWVVNTCALAPRVVVVTGLQASETDQGLAWFWITGLCLQNLQAWQSPCQILAPRATLARLLLACSVYSHPHGTYLRGTHLVLSGFYINGSRLRVCSLTSSSFQDTRVSALRRCFPSRSLRPLSCPCQGLRP